MLQNEWFFVRKLCTDSFTDRPVAVAFRPPSLALDFIRCRNTGPDQFMRAPVLTFNRQYSVSSDALGPGAITNLMDKKSKSVAKNDRHRRKVYPMTNATSSKSLIVGIIGIAG